MKGIKLRDPCKQLYMHPTHVDSFCHRNKPVWTSLDLVNHQLCKKSWMEAFFDSSLRYVWYVALFSKEVVQRCSLIALQASYSRLGQDYLTSSLDIVHMIKFISTFPSSSPPPLPHPHLPPPLPHPHPSPPLPSIIASSFVEIQFIRHSFETAGGTGTSLFSISYFKLVNWMTPSHSCHPQIVAVPWRYWMECSVDASLE